MDRRIIIAGTDEEIANCYPVMAELRPHIKVEEFVERIKHQTEIADYRLACLIETEVKAVAGFRISQNLAWGHFLYVDDLVSKSTDRSKGFGGELFDWLVDHAREQGCDQFHLDSGVQRFAAHRFYLAKRMAIEAHHFGMKLG